MFVAKKDLAAKSGPRQWKAGERLWDLHQPVPKMLTRNLASVIYSEEGQSNAGTLGLSKPEVAMDPSLFADEVLQAARTELVNRPAIGVSMMVGSIAALKTNLEEGATAGFLNPKFVEEFIALYTHYDIEACNHVLNLQAGPLNVGLVRN